MLDAAVEALDWGDVRVVARSSIYETEPVGGPEQPWFLNQVIAVDTTLDPIALWERCAAVEIALGRARTGEQRWGPRTIDVDVLLYDELTLAHPDLEVPHPRMHERAFVLVPLAELAPGLQIPGHGSVESCVSASVDRQVVRLLV